VGEGGGGGVIFRKVYRTMSTCTGEVRYTSGCAQR
jgi:hypothetical protein